MLESILGRELRAVRNERGMSLGEASEATGVSKPMLGQIERGQTSPSINTLWKIASGLKAPLSRFLIGIVNDYTVADIGAEEPITEEDGRMRAYTIFPFDPQKGFEAFAVEFDSGCEHCSHKHGDNIEELVMVCSGELEMIINGETVTLSTNKSIRFGADVSHTYRNATDSMCRIYNIIFYR